MTKKIYIPNLRIVKSPVAREPFYMKVARFVGRSAYYVRRVVAGKLFLALLALAIVYGIMRLTGISVMILRDGEALFTLK